MEDGAIAIVGLAGRYPGGADLAAFWETLITGRDVISEPPSGRQFESPEFELAEHPTARRAGWLGAIDTFDPRFFGISPVEATGIDPQERLFMEVAWAALEDAGLTPNTLVRSPDPAAKRAVGVFAGVMYGEYQLLAAEAALQGDFVLTGASPSSIANRLSYFCNFQGPSLAVDTACSSSLVAIHLAVQSLRRGECRAALAGGVNLILHPRHLLALHRLKMLANDGVCRPFGAGASGMVPGEGVGVVVLKPLADAERDGDRIWGVIRGSAVNSGGKVSGYTVPNPTAQAAVIRSALQDAMVDPHSLSYIEAHGTGTTLGDPIEVAGLTEALGVHDQPYCAIGSLKANIGHLEAAAGIAGLTKVLLQMRHGQLAPSLYAADPNPHIAFDQAPVRVQTQAMPWQTQPGVPRRAGISSFGAGGVNAHLIVEEYRSESGRSGLDPDPARAQTPWDRPGIDRNGSSAGDLHPGGTERNGFDRLVLDPAAAPVTASGLMVSEGEYVVPVSALDRERLQVWVRQLRSVLIQPQNSPQSDPNPAPGILATEAPIDWVALVWTLQTGRVALPYRLAVVAKNLNDLLSQWEAFLADGPIAQGLVGRCGPDDRVIRTRPDSPMALATAWVQGAEVDWEALWLGPKPSRVTLPSYPFELRPCWFPRPAQPVTASINTGRAEPLPASSPASSPDLPSAKKPPSSPGAVGVLIPDWQAIAPEAASGAAVDPVVGEVLLWIGPEAEGAAMAAAVQAHPDCCRFRRVIQVIPGLAFEPLPGDRYRLNSSRESDFGELLAHLADQGLAPTHVLFRSLATAAPDDAPPQAIRQGLTQTLYPLFYGLRALLRSPAISPSPVSWISLGEDPAAPWTAAAAAFCTAVGQESTRLRPAVLSGVTELNQPSRELLRAIALLWQRPELNHLQFQATGSRVRTWQLLDPAIDPGNPAPSGLWQGGGCYILTGGLGAIGQQLVENAIGSAPVSLVLVGRSPLDDRKTARLEAWRAQGAQITYVAADVGDWDGAIAVVNAARQTGRPLRGVIHAAGLIEDALLIHKDRPTFGRVLRPKVQGTVYLDYLTRQDPLDFFLCLSSLSALMGAPGQGDYAAANAFLDAWIQQRETQRQLQQRSGVSRTLNLPFWQGGGMALTEVSQAWMADMAGLQPLTPAQGLELIHWAIRQPHPQVAIAPGEPEKFQAFLQGRFQGHSATPAQSDRPLAANPMPAEPVAVQASASDTLPVLRSIISDLLGLRPEEIDPQARLGELGFDSLQLARLGEAIQKQPSDRAFNSALLFENPTVAALTPYLRSDQPAKPPEPAPQPIGSPVSPLGLTAVSGVQSPGAEAPTGEPTFAPSMPDRPGELAQTTRSRRFNPQEPIAIIGMAGRFPGANTLEDFWDNLAAGADCITEVPASRWNPDQYASQCVCRWGGFLDGVDQFDPLFFRISPREAVSMDPQERLFLQTAWHTLENAGYTPDRLRQAADGSPRRVGVFVGITWGSYQLLSAQEWLRSNQILGSSSYWSVANRVSWFLDCKGPSLAVDTACSSSLAAIHLAVQSLRRGECAVAIAGGVNLLLHPCKYVALSGLGFLAADGRCHSFGQGANGFVPGEGVGAVLLKPLSLAEADGDRIEAVILGSAINQDGLTTGYTVPNPEAQAELIELALQDAGISPATLSYVEAHGTGTTVGDPLELRGLDKAFRRYTDQSHFCALGSVKSNIGHLEAAAGVAGVIKVALQMRHQTLVPTLHCTPPNPVLDFSHSPFVLQTARSPWVGERRAGISSFGAGGTNVHVILASYEPTPAAVVPASGDRPQAPLLLPLSARHPAALERQVRNLAQYLETHGATLALADVAATLHRGRVPMECRAAVMADSVPAAIQALKRWSIGALANALPAAAQAWLAGGPLPPWAGSGSPVPLPGYSFEPERYWLALTSEPTTAPLPPLPPRFYPIWRSAPLERCVSAAAVLFFAPNLEALQAVRDRLAPRLVIGVLPGTGSFELLAADPLPMDFRIDPHAAEHYSRLLAACPPVQCLIQAWDLTELAADSRSNRDLQHTPLHRMFLLSQALLQTQSEPLDIHYVFSGAGGDVPGRVAVAGFRRSLTAACARLRLRTIRVEAEAKAWAGILTDEVQTPWMDADILYRLGKRYGEDWVAWEAAAAPAVTLRPRSVILVTGGAGALGSQVALYLARHHQARLVLTGRSPLSPAIEAQLAAIRRTGGEARYYAVDLTDRISMEVMVAHVTTEWGAIEGLVHCAGLQGQAALGSLSWSEFAAVLRPKILGVQVLQTVLDWSSLSLRILFSSLAAVAGDLGSCNYACANRYLDAVAEASGGVAIAWPLWAEGGMSLDAQAQDLYLAATGLRLLQTSAALQVLAGLFASEHARVVICDGEPPALERLLRPWLSGAVPAATTPPPIAATIPEQIAPAIAPPTAARLTRDLTNPLTTDPLTTEQLTNELAEMAGAVLAIAPHKLQPQTPFSEYGFDSMLLREFATRINRRYAIDLSPALFFRVGTLAALAEHLQTDYASAIAAVLVPPAVDGVELNDGTVVAMPQSPTLPLAPAWPDQDSGVAIIGISGLFPGSPSLQDFWQNLVAGTDLIVETPPERWDWRDCAAQLAGTGREEAARWGGFLTEVATFDPLFFGISPREAEQMDPQHRLFLQQAWHALEDAGIRPSSLAGSRTAVFVGVQMNEYVERFGPDAGPQVATGNAHAMIANRLSYLLDLRGPSEIIDTACSSSLVAVHRAAQAIRSGEATLAIAGGVHLLLSPTAVMMAARMGVLSPDGRCYTFDSRANGYVKGEGVGVVCLKSLAQARADRDHIYGVIRASGVNHGGHGMSLTAPNPQAQADLIAQVYQQAAVDPASITLIETHGTGTALGDPIEVDALTEAFGRLTGPATPEGADRPAPRRWLGSVKTNIGHLEPASGIAGLLKVLLAMQHRQIPPTLHQQSLNPLLHLERGGFQIATTPQPWEPAIDPSGQAVLRAGVSSFGFGGANCHLLLERVLDSAATPAPALAKPQPEVIPLSAKTPQALRSAVVALRDALQTEGERYGLADVAHTLQTGREALTQRVAFVAPDYPTLFEQMQTWLEQGQWPIGELIETSPLAQLAQAWQAGQAELSAIAQASDRPIPPQKVPLPGYPFSQTRHWIPRSTSVVAATGPEAVSEAVSEVVSAAVSTAVSAGLVTPAGLATPASTAMATLRSLLSQTLGLDSALLTEDTDLSTVGVDSLVQADLRRSLERLWGRSLPANLFLAHPTLAQLQGALGPLPAPAAPAGTSPLMVFHDQGSQPASFWIHGAPGDTNWLQSLSQYLGPDFPLMGIEANESVAQESITALAEHYLSLIETFHPAIDYRLGGYSFGGTVAVEMCRLLEQRGQSVTDLILLDTYAPGSEDLRSIKEHPAITDPAFAPLLITNLLVHRWRGSRPLSLDDFQTVAPADYASLMTDHLAACSPLRPEQLRRLLDKNLQLAARHDRLLSAYHPEPFACRARVTLFRSTLGFTAADNPLALPAIQVDLADSPATWQTLLQTPITTHNIASDHFGLLAGAAGQSVANQLKTLLGHRSIATGFAETALPKSS